MSEPRTQETKRGSARLPLRQTAETSRARYHRLVAGAFVVDLLMVTAALLLAQWIRFETKVAEFGVPVEDIFRARDYIGHIVIGVALMMATLTNFRLYTRENLLSYTNTLRILFKSSFVWILCYLALTLMLKFDPPISRVFCAIGLVTTLLILPLWRGILWRVLSREENSGSLRQRALVVGWSRDFSRAVKVFGEAADRPFDIVGVIAPPGGDFQEEVPPHMPVMGSYESLETLLQLGVCQMVIVADDALKSGTLMHIASICEKEMVEFKLVPTCFQVLLSGLHLESVGGIPILGISRLPLHSTVNRYVKRGIDLLGGLVGLALAAPVIAVFGLMIYRESPGPIFYRQRRLGANGKTFDMIKLRSMKLDAEKTGVGWTVKNDPRCLRVGAFMRRWNIDEIPQFWNVVKGDMSLVGPRPERPELIEQFKEEIPHYNARHNIKPGITGWAQVNGLRGDTDLSERVRFDLHYIENWNVLLDFQIMFLTFVKREGAC
ncbi:MAG: sugar transferase [Verrucomicrobiales bacterium]|nr:sugar transferase [Verrucomicrobiales bacterium]